MIDSHCHIDGREFDDDRGEVLERARLAGVSPLIVVGTGKTADDLRRALRLAAAEPDVFAIVGVHPHDAAHLDDALLGEVRRMLGEPRVVGLGEIGLDYYYKHATPEEQRRALRRQLELAAELDVPVVLHVRDAGPDQPGAHDEVIALLGETGAGPRALIHCFTGTPRDVAAYVRLGCHISFSGVVTFPSRSAAPVRDAARLVPEDRLLAETDSPYLAPVPKRGQRNEPAYVAYTIADLAWLRERTPAEMATVTEANTRRFFRLGGA